LHAYVVSSPKNLQLKWYIDICGQSLYRIEQLPQHIPPNLRHNTHALPSYDYHACSAYTILHALATSPSPASAAQHTTLFGDTCGVV
jgi:hypothetical protein